MAFIVYAGWNPSTASMRAKVSVPPEAKYSLSTIFAGKI